MSFTLTDGERLLLERKRRHQTQSEAAARYSVSPKLYGLWERDQREVPFTFRKKVFKMVQYERCLIRRRREDLTQAAVAKEMGCSRWWLNRMEQGQAPAGELAWYWSD